ncbi:MAG: hypothetical protein DME45_11625 [Verrucomicrobia bacterium]|nr:MAG: hypothetical protein DME45_11625 [Verrucomicrobiota bacterium]
MLTWLRSVIGANESRHEKLIKFLVGLAWTGVIVWFTATSYPHNPHIHELGFVILFTSGAFGWMPLARSVYPQAPELWSLALSLGVALACAAVVIMVSEQGFPASGALLSAWNTTNISAPLLTCEVPSKFLEIPSTSLASSRTTKL